MIYKHLTIEERELIQLRLWEKKSIRAIAGELGRPPSSVSREVNRNLPAIMYRYTPRLAHERALIKRKNRGRQDRLKNERIREYVIKYLKKRWSPEQIANTIKPQLTKVSPTKLFTSMFMPKYTATAMAGLGPAAKTSGCICEEERNVGLPRAPDAANAVLNLKELQLTIVPRK